MIRLVLVLALISVSAFASNSARFRQISPEVLQMLQEQNQIVKAENFDYEAQDLDVHKRPLNGDDLECEHSDKAPYCLSKDHSRRDY